MDWLSDFLEKHMSKAVFVTVISSLLQFFGYASPDNNQIPDEVFKQIMASSSGLQAVMLMILWLFVKNQKDQANK